MITFIIKEGGFYIGIGQRSSSVLR